MISRASSLKSEKLTSEQNDRIPILFSVDVEEYYHAENILNALPISKIRTLPSRVEVGTHKILALLARSGGRATFFVLGCVAEGHKGLIKRIDAEGHEVASHGYDHIPLHKHTAKTFGADLNRSTQILSDITGKKVLGYRATSFSLTAGMEWFFDVLRKSGIRYDSSIAFSWFRRSFNEKERERGPFEISKGIIEFPIPSARFGPLKIPLGGGYFRILPVSLTKWGLKQASRSSNTPPVFYIHPWELDPDQPRFSMPILKRWRHRVNLSKTERATAVLLDQTVSVSIKQYLVDAYHA